MDDNQTLEIDGNEPSDSKQKRANVKKDKKPVPKWLLWLLVLVLLLGVGAGVYYWQQQTVTEQSNKITTLEAQNAKLKKQVKDLKSDLSDAEKSAEESTGPSDDDLANIQAAISTENYAALEGYMADSVTVILAASEGLGERTPVQAVADLAYLSDADTPWDFALDSATLSGWASGGYGVYFPDGALVGRSADGYVVSFQFNDAGDITDIFFTGSDELL
ncbi:uroporphyrinogen-III C-methyltransferase [Candidatus Saccharibacteria bacterium]|nr:uroporphyrinogen-III C-methyltransferase [Candidatus Saccharibacteria bacterium]